MPRSGLPACTNPRARRCLSDPQLGTPCPDVRPEIGPCGTVRPEGMSAWAWRNDRRAGARAAGPRCSQESAKNDRTEPSRSRSVHRPCGTVISDRFCRCCRCKGPVSGRAEPFDPRILTASRSIAHGSGRAEPFGAIVLTAARGENNAAIRFRTAESRASRRGARLKCSGQTVPRGQTAGLVMPVAVSTIGLHGSAPAMPPFHDAEAGGLGQR